MKRASILLFALVLATLSLAHQEGETVPREPEGPLETHQIPLTKPAQEALGKILAHLECGIGEFFQMSGIDFPGGGSCAYDRDRGRVELKSDRQGVMIAIMFLGDLMMTCADASVTERQILERFAFEGHPSKSWTRVWQDPGDWDWEKGAGGPDRAAAARGSKIRARPGYVEVAPPPAKVGKKHPEYWERMATGKELEDLRPVNPADTTDLRELALSLPIVETRSEAAYQYFYGSSKAAPEAGSWTLPGDGAQYPAEIRRLRPGESGRVRIEVEMGLWIDTVEHRHVARLERRTGGWSVLEGRLFRLSDERSEVQTEGKDADGS